MDKIILLSGEPRVGKTTALKKIIQTIGSEKCVGFFTEEVKVDNNRIGFDCVSLNGERRRIADINYSTDVRIGRYGIDVKGFDDFLKKIFNEKYKNKILIIDEIGPIQFLSTSFKNKIIDIMSSSNFIVGTIYYKAHTEIDEIKKLHNINIYSLTIENRDSIVNEIIGYIDSIYFIKA